MATVNAFIRTSKKKAERVHIRFRLRDGRTMQLFHKSKIEVDPKDFDEKKQEIRPRAIMLPAEKDEIDRKIANRKSLVREIYNAATVKDGLTSEWLELEIDKRLFPEKYETYVPQTFFEAFEEFLQKRKLSDWRIRAFNVVIRALRRYEMYVQQKGKQTFTLALDSLIADDLRSIEKFLREEHLFADQYPAIYEAVPESRKPQPRGQNTINGIMTKIRTFFIWANDEGKTKNNPFKTFPIEECVYGDPYFITIEERNKLSKTNLSRHSVLAEQRDIFIFQCHIGCRVGDLYKMTRENIIDGAIEYIARKTKDGNPVTVRVPLNDSAKQILEKYSYCTPKILPLITQQDYNIAIKSIFLAARLTRPVIILNTITREPEIRPLNEIASSHIARRTLIGNLYNKVKDPNLIGALSGHKEGSRAFGRYRKIGDEIKTELIQMLE